MIKLPYYKEYNSAAENEEEADMPKWTQKITFPLKHDVYSYIKSKESALGAIQSGKEGFSQELKHEEDETIIEFSHEQAMYMFYLAMGSFGITPNQMKKFADDIEAGNIVEPYPLR
jgi:hypothetical protein